MIARNTLIAIILLATPVQAGWLITLETPRIVAEAIRIPGNDELCWRGIVIGIRLHQPAHVSVRLNGQLVLSGVDGSGSFTDGTARVVGRGEHRIAVAGDAVGKHVAELGVRLPFAVDAREAREPRRVETVSGILESDLNNPPVLPLGRTFVRGVDLFDGHVVLEADDRVLGHGDRLVISRTYSSAGRRTSGVMGAGWSFGWDMSLTAEWPCNAFVVHLGSGTGLVFQKNQGGGLEPLGGYHSRLIENPDRSFDYYDLGGTRYRFASLDGRRHRWRRLPLRSVTDPSGAEIVLRRDREGRLVRVEENRRGGARLEIVYTRAGGFDRVAEVRDTLRRATVHYSYDDWGNLVLVTRRAAGKEEVRGRYSYRVEDAQDPHQVLSAETPGLTMRYGYYGPAERFLGESARVVGLQPFGKTEYARDVVAEAEKDSGHVRYAYDYSQWPAAVRSWVASSDELGQKVTLYELDREGRFVKMEEHAAPPAGLLARLLPRGWTPSLRTVAYDRSDR